MTQLVTFLKNSHAELIPAWLTEIDQKTIVPAELCRLFLSSRTVFYPGSGVDGCPVAAFNQSCAAHCYVYVDYLFTREELENEMKPNFLGYDTLLSVDLSTINIAQYSAFYATIGRIRPPPTPTDPYGVIYVFQRKRDFDHTHGAIRFAVMFLGADAYAAFGALFCQAKDVPAPFCVIVQDHGFGGNHDRFGRGGLLENISMQARKHPKLLLVGENTKAWEHYERCDAEPESMGMHHDRRFLYMRSEVGP